MESIINTNIMKKLIFALIAIIAIADFSFSQKKINILDLPGFETALIVNLNNRVDFKEYYLFQYVDIEIYDFSKAKSITLIQTNPDYIKIDCDGNLIVFTLDSNYRNQNEIIFYGYGLSKRNGNFKIDLEIVPTTNLSNSIISNGIKNSKITCHSGGVGSTECSVTPSDMNLGTASCSVKCSNNYHSYCDDVKGECGCLPNEDTGGTKAGPKKPNQISPN